MDAWAARGVLLLNTKFTFTKHTEAYSSSWWEWDELAKEIIVELSTRMNGLVFIMWGGLAQGYEQYVDTTKHRVIRSPHPSPLSARRGSGFFGSRPFTTCNAKLIEMGQEPIDWRLP